MRRGTRFTTLGAVGSSIAAFSWCACVDGFRGSNIQIDLSPGTPVQASVDGVMAAGELPPASHFRIYAIQENATENQMFEVQRFEVHRIVDPSSPCFIDVGDHVPHPGLHVASYAARIAQDTGITDIANPPPGATEQQRITMATAVQRMRNVAALASAAGIKVVTSVSPGMGSNSPYPPVAADCAGPANEIPPPSCIDDASNQRRLALCQATWKADPGLFEGTDRVLTAPLNGITRGMVVGLNPINMAPVGGAQFFVDDALDNVDAYAIYTQADGLDEPGTQLFFGRPTMPTRGVSHVHLTSPLSPQLTSEMAVFADLGQDSVQF